MDSYGVVSHLGAGGRQGADQGSVRRNNLALVLRLLRSEGSRLRARIAEETGLNKATVSSLVGELIDRGLLRDVGIQREGNVGRPGTAVELDGRAISGIGLEVNVDYVAVMALNLRDEVLFERRLPLDVAGMHATEALDLVSQLGAEAVAANAGDGILAVGATLSIPGLVDVERGVLTFAPNLGWRDVDLVAGLRQRLSVPLHVDNDANLSAVGEFVMGGVAGTSDLVYVTGEVGVGGGVISGGRLLRGREGFAGEVGHLPLNPRGDRCGCGRSGCWETMVGLAALLRAAADDTDPVWDRSLDLEERLALLARRAEDGDERTLAALHDVGVGLGLGASVLVNLFNPEVIVLGGYFATLGAYFFEPLERELQARVVAPTAHARVELSRLGFTAAVRGGAQVALDRVMSDPTVVPVGAGATVPRTSAS